MNNVISLFRPGPMPRHARPRGAQLTTAQRNQAAEIAARFDPKADSLELRREMREAFRAADIRPGEDLRNVLKEAGFKMARPAQEEDDQGLGPEVPRRKPRDLGPPPGLPEFITSFVRRRQAGEVSQSEANAFTDKVRQMAPSPRGIFVNIVA